MEFDTTVNRDPERLQPAEKADIVLTGSAAGIRFAPVFRRFAPRLRHPSAKESLPMAALNFEALRSTPTVPEPFPHLVVPRFVMSDSLVKIEGQYPRLDSPGSFPLDGLTYGPAFQTLLDELNGPKFRKLCEEKFQVDLTGRPTTITVRGRCGTRDGNIHTDSETKIITVLLYMNSGWEQSGGRLRLVRSPTDIEDVIVEVPPVEGTLVAFRRTDNSYHGHKPFIGPRRVIQFNWVTDCSAERRGIWRHRLSAWAKKLTGFRRQDSPDEYGNSWRAA
jgi:SM-20-related protein